MSNEDNSGGQLPHYPLHIAGQWCEGAAGARFDAINPYTRRVWATVAQAEVQDVRKAIASARETFDRTWSRVNGYERARLMMKLADLLQADVQRLGRLESTDNGGSVHSETQTQMVLAARQYRFSPAMRTSCGESRFHWISETYSTTPRASRFGS